MFEDVETNRDDVEFVLDISPEMERRRHIEEKMAIMRNELLEPLEEMCGKPAPELDVAQWLYGKPVTLAKLKGKIVVLHFWPNGFHYNGIRGIEAIRLLNVLQKEYGKYGVVFIGIHESKSDADEQRKLMNEEEIALRIALDRKLPAAEARGATFGRYDDPAGNIVVDRAGNIYGRVHYDKLEETIQKLVSQQH